MKKIYEEHLHERSLIKGAIFKDDKYVYLYELGSLDDILHTTILNTDKDYDIQIRDNNKVIIIEKERAEQ